MTDPVVVSPGSAGRDETRAAFIARLTAGATHELRNVLAIVKESAGLVADLVEMQGPPGQEQPDKVQWALDRIQLQVTRGTELSNSLNRIMHGLDREEARIDLAEAVRHTGRLSRRFAHQNRRTIELEEGPDDLVIDTHALDLYMALVALMEACVLRVPEEGSLAVRPERQAGRPAVRFSAGPDTSFGEAAAAVETQLGALVAGLQARIDLDAGGHALLLRFE